MAQKFGRNKPDYKPNDVVLTTKYVFDALQLEFDLDPAHPPFQTHVPCKRYYTEADDGLAQPWEGLVWMNPPYSKPAPWVEKFIDHGNGIALLPISKSKWFGELWLSDATIMFPTEASKFATKQAFEQNGKPFSIFMPLVLVAMGETATEALQNSGLGRIR